MASSSARLAASADSCRSLPATFMAPCTASSSDFPAARRRFISLTAFMEPLIPAMTPSKAPPMMPPSKAFFKRPSSSESLISVAMNCVKALFSAGLSACTRRSERRPALPSKAAKSVTAPLTKVPRIAAAVPPPAPPSQPAVAPTAPGIFEAAPRTPPAARNPVATWEIPDTMEPDHDVLVPNGFVCQSGRRSMVAQSARL